MARYEQEKGVCFFAYNNEQIDYGALAILASRQVKQKLGLPVCLITDEGTVNWIEQSRGADLVNESFDYIISKNIEHAKNERGHYDSPWSSFKAPFKNSNKHFIYDYSPFEKTLLLDIDYFVNSNFLLPWLDVPGVTMYNDSLDIQNRQAKPGEQYLNTNGIPMWWSTVIAFDRSADSKIFFETWAHVADNYSYYQMLYNFPGSLFRTDYCVSVATHLMNGMMPGEVINNFNVPMINMEQKDELFKVKDDYWYFLSNNREENWKDIAVKMSDTDMHLMNKRAIMRNFDSIMENQNG